MPWGDGKGPWWASGNWTCRGGRGMGPGRGIGRGMGRRMFMMQPPNKGTEMSMLENYVKELETELEAVKQRISELRK